jgi:hypothetical protein
MELELELELELYNGMDICMNGVEAKPSAIDQ